MHHRLLQAHEVAELAVGRAAAEWLLYSCGDKYDSGNFAFGTRWRKLNKKLYYEYHEWIIMKNKKSRVRIVNVNEKLLALDDDSFWRSVTKESLKRA